MVRGRVASPPAPSGRQKFLCGECASAGGGYSAEHFSYARTGRPLGRLADSTCAEGTVQQYAGLPPLLRPSGKGGLERGVSGAGVSAHGGAEAH